MNHTEYNTNYMRKKRIERKEKGLCVVCGARPAKEDRVCCQVCIKRNSNRKRKTA